MATMTDLTEQFAALIEWLPKQITKDRRDAPDIHEMDCSKVGDRHEWCDCPWPDRMTAECDAKEQLLAHLLATKHGGYSTVIRYMALAYADRDGWREEWRP